MARRALAHLRDAVVFETRGTVVGYWPMSDEFDDVPMLRHFADAGWTCGLPTVVGLGRPLVFRRWRPGEALVAARFGTSEPPPESPIVVPDVLLVPLLAFDRQGFRLGYGGGFYDRTLAGLRAGHAVTAIGVAFAGQEVDRVPRGAADQRLDWIITEEGALNIATARPNTDKS